MTPHEKAVEIFEQYFFKLSCHFHAVGDEVAKQCALIAVDEMIDMLPFTDINTYIGRWCEQQRNFLNEVKHEIEKL
jgi:hypothetical protein